MINERDLTGRFSHARVLVTTTPTALPEASFELTRGVQIKAMPTNTDIVYIGGSGVTVDNGFPLAPGDSVFMPTHRMSSISAVAASNQYLANLWL